MLLLPSSSTDLRSRGTEKVAIYGVNPAGEGRGGCLEVTKLGFSPLTHCRFELEFLQFCSVEGIGRPSAPIINPFIMGEGSKI